MHLHPDFEYKSFRAVQAEERARLMETPEGRRLLQLPTIYTRESVGDGMSVPWGIVVRLLAGLGVMVLIALMALQDLSNPANLTAFVVTLIVGLGSIGTTFWYYRRKSRPLLLMIRSSRGSELLRTGSEVMALAEASAARASDQEWERFLAEAQQVHQAQQTFLRQSHT